MIMGGKKQSQMMHLHVCNYLHEEIVHGYRRCPLCDTINANKEIISKLGTAQETIDQLELNIEELSTPNKYINFLKFWERKEK